MPGMLLLSGGGEFQKGNEAADRRAIELAGGLDASIIILPTAGGADGGVPSASRNGVNWFTQLGANQVQALPLVTRADADNPAMARTLSEANLIYIAGGSPAYLQTTLEASLCWQAVVTAYHNGAVLAGASAGAMVLMEHLYDPASRQIRPGLGLVPGAIFAPHFNGFGRQWVATLRAALPQALLLGVDEKVSIIGQANSWQVFGRGWITIYRQDGPAKYQGGQVFKLQI